MHERINFLKQQNPDLLISIHLNSADIDTVQGCEYLLPVYWFPAFEPGHFAKYVTINRACMNLGMWEVLIFH